MSRIINTKNDEGVLTLGTILKINCFLQSEEAENMTRQQIASLFNISLSTVNRIRLKKEGKYKIIPLLIEEILDNDCSTIDDYNDKELNDDILSLLEEKNMLNKNKKLYFFTTSTTQKVKKVDSLNYNLLDESEDNNIMPNRFKVEFKILQFLIYLNLHPEIKRYSYVKLENLFKISRTTISDVLKNQKDSHKKLFKLLSDNPDIITFYKNKETQKILDIFAYKYLLVNKSLPTIKANLYLFKYYKKGLENGVFTVQIDDSKFTYKRKKRKLSKKQLKRLDQMDDTTTGKKAVVKSNIHIKANYRSSSTIKQLAEYFDSKIYEKPRWEVNFYNSNNIKEVK